MYEWLNAALHDGGTVVTANRRLARTLGIECGVLQKALGKSAWRKPEILAWQDCLFRLFDQTLQQERLPTRINSHQSQWLWENCWRHELGEGAQNVSGLAKLSRDAWQRLADWQVSIDEVASAAHGDDQRAFSAVAGRYRYVLQRDNMIDNAGLGTLVLDLIADGRINLADKYTFVGFDREKPIVRTFEKALRLADAETQFVPQRSGDLSCTLQTFDDATAEYRAAGAWARAQIEQNANASIAIIATGLDSDADSISRAVLEGVAPGWQYGHDSLREAVNVSFGRRLVDYPAIAIAFTLIRWLVDDIRSTDVSVLLRSAVLGQQDIAGRSRMELRLRQLPDRQWSPSLLSSEFRGHDECPAVLDWLARLAAFSKRRQGLATSASPAEWAVTFDEALTAFSWPGESSLDSNDFQLVNRWRELLNEFARLVLMSPKMSARDALGRLEGMAVETVFQPESRETCLQLLGPLEASGLEFDAVWISGLNANDWPPASSASVLISRRLQERYAMPDWSPDDSFEFARQMLLGLVDSAGNVVCSYALADDDTEQSASELLSFLALQSANVSSDPGWFAGSLQELAGISAVADKVPQVLMGEKIAGGAAAIQRQMSEPISAFIQSRLLARVIYPQVVGVSALVRGNLIHDTLYHLYKELPTSSAIAAWSESELRQRIDAAMDYAFFRHEKNSDTILHQLLTLERARIGRLLHQFVGIDCARGTFKIASVEGEFEFASGPVHLPLRFDRLDSYDDGSIAILDYKTGSRKQLLNRRNEVQEIQLFVYAAATDADVSALALVNVDSREIHIDGAGSGYTNGDDWPQLLQELKDQIVAACAELASGDVRLHRHQGVIAARPLNLLTRYSEIRREQR